MIRLDASAGSFTNCALGGVPKQTAAYSSCRLRDCLYLRESQRGFFGPVCYPTSQAFVPNV